MRARRSRSSFQKRLFFDSTSRLAFLREVAIWSRLTGVAHVVPVIGLEVFDDRPFVFMPAYDRTLRDLLTNERPGIDTVAALVVQMAFGLTAAGLRVEGLVHGDLKPENMFVTQSGVLLISDFGLARAAQDSMLRLRGGPTYLAPESWDDPPRPIPATDVYAYGAILYELLSGRPPFDASVQVDWESAHRTQSPPPLPAASSPLGDRLGGLAIRCLEKRPEDRPASFREIHRQLREAIQDADPILALTLFASSLQERDTMAELRRRTPAPPSFGL